MVSVSVLGFENFASQIWKIDICHQICEKKTSPYGHLAKLVPQKRHHMGISQSSCPKKLEKSFQTAVVDNLIYLNQNSIHDLSEAICFINFLFHA